LQIHRLQTACFSGHRPDRFPFSLECENSPQYHQLQYIIRGSVLSAYEKNYRTFLCGMAKGWDLICGIIVLDLIRLMQPSDMELIAVLPFEKQTFAGKWGKLHKSAKEGAKCEIVAASTEYTRDCYKKRNALMVNNSSLLICYLDSLIGGTAQTYQMAKKKNLEIINLCEKFN
jgi:hypothetical protein